MVCVKKTSGGLLIAWEARAHDLALFGWLVAPLDLLKRRMPMCRRNFPRGTAIEIMAQQRKDCRGDSAEPGYGGAGGGSTFEQLDLMVVIWKDFDAVWAPLGGADVHRIPHGAIFFLRASLEV